MDFNEAVTQARAAHTRTRTVHRPENYGATEFVCKCEAYVFAQEWAAHILEAADELLGRDPDRGLKL